MVALAVTEGEDKPLKDPVMFRKADLVLITKIDLLPHLPGVHVETIADALARVMPRPLYLPVSAHTGEGMERWLEWLTASNWRRDRARLWRSYRNAMRLRGPERILQPSPAFTFGVRPRAPAVVRRAPDRALHARHARPRCQAADGRAHVARGCR